MTDTQLRVVRFLDSYHKRNGYYATIRDVQEQFEWKSHTTAAGVLEALVVKGFVVRTRITKGQTVFVPSEEW